MLITIIFNRISWEEKQLVTEAKRKGVNVDTLDNRNVFFDLEKKNFETDVFLQRSLSYLRGLYSTAILENQGYHVVNSYTTTRVCGDKLITSLSNYPNKGDNWANPIKHPSKRLYAILKSPLSEIEGQKTLDKLTSDWYPDYD